MLDRTYHCVTVADITVKQVKVLSAERLGGGADMSGVLEYSALQRRNQTLTLRGVTSCALPHEHFCKHFRNLFIFFLDKNTISQTTTEQKWNG